MKNYIGLVLLCANIFLSGMEVTDKKEPDDKIKEAVRKDSKEECEVLVANVNAVDGFTPLTYAAFEGHKEVCEILMRSMKDMKDKIALNEQLIEAATNGSKEECELLLASGADVNALDSCSWTPLIFSALYGHKEVCEVLIANGADVNAIDNCGDSVLKHAVWNGDKEVCKLLILHGAHVNAINEYNRTALMIAVWNGDKDICELLIAHGADVNAVDKDGRTALMKAAENGSREVCELLIVQGAHLNLRDNKDMTAAMLAAVKGYKEICKLFLINLLLRGNSKITINEAKDKLFTVHLALQGKLPHDMELEIISGLKDDLSVLLASKYATSDGLPPVLREAVAVNVVSFLLSEEGKKLLEDLQKIANDDVKHLFTVKEVVNIFPGQLGECLQKSFQK